MFKNFLHLFYPHVCLGCGSSQLERKQLLCAKCISQLPKTHFLTSSKNLVERIFIGRIPVENSAALYYYQSGSLLQHLIIQLKYHGNPDVGLFLGRMLGMALKENRNYDQIDLMIPLPLHPKKHFQRGYNQAEIICLGIQEIWGKPIHTSVVMRNKFTATQTQQDRLHRWVNMQDAFQLKAPDQIQGKHILLVDDIITTGATLEACGNELLKANQVKLSIIGAAFTL